MNISSLELREHLLDLVKSGQVPGIRVCASVDLQPAFDFCCGHELIGDSSSKPYSNKSIFNVGSATKPVTGVLLYRLVQDGKIALNAPAKYYLPDFGNGEITIFQLLTHTSGMAVDADNPLTWPETADCIPAYLAKIKAHPPKCKPGSSMAYFSQGYSLLMQIIEGQAGMSIEEYAQQTLFSPLLMQTAHYDVRMVDVAEIILPWDGERLCEQYRYAPPTGDSGLLATAEDMVKFGELFLRDGGDGVPLSAQTRKTMLTECTGDKFRRASAFFYNGGCGGGKRCFGNHRSAFAVAHPGFTGCCVLVDPPQRLSVGITSNSIPFHSKTWDNYGDIFDYFRQS